MRAHSRRSSRHSALWFCVLTVTLAWIYNLPTLFELDVTACRDARDDVSISVTFSELRANQLYTTTYRIG